MKSKNVGTLIQEKEDLYDLLEDIMERIREFREEMQAGLDGSGRHGCGNQRNKIPLIW